MSIQTKTKDQRIDYALRYTWLNISKMFNEEASKHGSTMSAAFTLLSIDPKKGTSSTALGPKVGVEPTSLSRTLNNLEKRELINRKPNPNDGRGVIVSLTEEGHRLRNISKKTVLRFYEEVEENISKSKLDTFFSVIQTINNLIEDNKIYKQHEQTH